MNYSNSSGLVATEMPKQELPIAPQVIEGFDKNLSLMWSHIDMFENRCHKLLNQRTPVADEKTSTPTENDFVQQLGNRMLSFAKANERLQAIVNHLDKIV